MVSTAVSSTIASTITTTTTTTEITRNLINATSDLCASSYEDKLPAINGK